jgi:hypothetical protein
MSGRGEVPCGRPGSIVASSGVPMRLAPLLLGVAAVLGGCGGGGGGGDGGPVTVTIEATESLDGLVQSDGFFAVVGEFIAVGDVGDSGEPGVGVRGFVSFDITGVPSTAIVLSAVLTLDQFAVSGDVYGSLGPVLVDQVAYGNVLEAGAYSRSFPINQGMGPLSSDATPGPKSLDITAAVQFDHSTGSAQTQYRLYCPFETDMDGDNDLALFLSANTADPDKHPRLVVTYVP